MFLETVITLAAAAPEAAGELSKFEQITREFGINGRILFAQVINFGIVAFLLWKFAFKPVISTLDERQKKISDGLQYAEQARIELAEAEKRQAAIIRDANQEAQKIIGEAHEIAKSNSEKTAQETASRAEAIMAKAEQAVTQERQNMLTEIRKEAAELVVQTTAKILRKDLSPEEQSRYNKTASQELLSLN